MAKLIQFLVSIALSLVLVSSDDFMDYESYTRGPTVALSEWKMSDEIPKELLSFILNTVLLKPADRANLLTIQSDSLKKFRALDFEDVCRRYALSEARIAIAAFCPTNSFSCLQQTAQLRRDGCRDFPELNELIDWLQSNYPYSMTNHAFEMVDIDGVAVRHFANEVKVDTRKFESLIRHEPESVFNFLAKCIGTHRDNEYPTGPLAHIFIPRTPPPAKIVDFPSDYRGRATAFDSTCERIRGHYNHIIDAYSETSFPYRCISLCTDHTFVTNQQQLSTKCHCGTVETLVIQYKHQGCSTGIKPNLRYTTWDLIGFWLSDFFGVRTAYRVGDLMEAPLIVEGAVNDLTNTVVHKAKLSPLAIDILFIFFELTLLCLASFYWNWRVVYMSIYIVALIVYVLIRISIDVVHTVPQNFVLFLFRLVTFFIVTGGLTKSFDVYLSNVLFLGLVSYIISAAFGIVVFICGVGSIVVHFTVIFFISLAVTMVLIANTRNDYALLLYWSLAKGLIDISILFLDGLQAAYKGNDDAWSDFPIYVFSESGGIAKVFVIVKWVMKYTLPQDAYVSIWNVNLLAVLCYTVLRILPRLATIISAHFNPKFRNADIRNRIYFYINFIFFDQWMVLVLFVEAFNAVCRRDTVKYRRTLVRPRTLFFAVIYYLFSFDFYDILCTQAPMIVAVVLYFTMSQKDWLIYLEIIDGHEDKRYAHLSPAESSTMLGRSLKVGRRSVGVCYAQTHNSVLILDRLLTDPKTVVLDGITYTYKKSLIAGQANWNGKTENLVKLVLNKNLNLPASSAPAVYHASVSHSSRNSVFISNGSNIFALSALNTTSGNCILTTDHVEYAEMHGAPVYMKYVEDGDRPWSTMILIGFIDSSLIRTDTEVGILSILDSCDHLSGVRFKLSYTNQINRNLLGTSDDHPIPVKNDHTAQSYDYGNPNHINFVSAGTTMASMGSTAASGNSATIPKPVSSNLVSTSSMIPVKQPPTSLPTGHAPQNQLFATTLSAVRDHIKMCYNSADHTAIASAHSTLRAKLFSFSPMDPLSDRVANSIISGVQSALDLWNGTGTFLYPIMAVKGALRLNFGSNFSDSLWTASQFQTLVVSGSFNPKLIPSIAPIVNAKQTGSATVTRVVANPLPSTSKTPVQQKRRTTPSSATPVTTRGRAMATKHVPAKLDAPKIHRAPPSGSA